jgi:hypothetical protein
LIGEFVAGGQGITTYAMYWFQGQGVILEQKFCSTTIDINI